MGGRVTPRPEPEGYRSFRERNPAMWWVAVIAAVSLVLGSFASALVVLLS